MYRLSLAVLLLAAALPLGAAPLIINITGLDIVYDGTDLYDAGGAVGGLGLPADADPVDTVEFLVNGGTVGALSTDVFVDFFISGVSNIPVGGGAVMSAGNGNAFGFDLLTSLLGWGLALDIDQVAITYAGPGVLQVSFDGIVAGVAYQDLPFGLLIDEGQAVNFSFVGAVSASGDDGSYLTDFDADGTAEIGGPSPGEVPEPGSLTLFGLGLALVGFGARSRRWGQA